MHPCDGLQDGVCVLGRHGIELADARVAVAVVDGSEVGVQLVYEGMELLVRQAHRDLVCGVRTEGEWGAFGAVQLLEAFGVPIPKEAVSGELVQRF